MDNSHRDLHGALIDADLLAAVYVELQGGRQPGLQLDTSTDNQSADEARPEDTHLSGFILTDRPVRPARRFTVPEQEAEDHKKLVTTMDDPIWQR
ncbi:MAG: hypothetical protein VXW11_08295 [Pseudomonadota bacterium]|nr:hypothetical protein [Pseudomonadota bacterium]